MKKTTLITGASNGIGLELASIFAREGHDLILVARSKDKLLALKQELEAKHSIQVKVIDLDLSLRESPGKLFASIQERGWKVEYLVNNAGFGDFGAFIATDWLKEERMIRLNILTLTELCKYFSNEMAARKSGRIMNLASTAAFQPGPLMAVYYASKAYVLHFSEALHEELREFGVSVTALCPGATQSGFQEAASMTESMLVKGRKLPTSAEVAEYGYRAMMRGQAVAIHGTMNWLLAESVRLTPRAWIVRVVHKIQGRAKH